MGPHTDCWPIILLYVDDALQTTLPCITSHHPSSFIAPVIFRHSPPHSPPPSHHRALIILRFSYFPPVTIHIHREQAMLLNDILGVERDIAEFGLAAGEDFGGLALDTTELERTLDELVGPAAVV